MTFELGEVVTVRAALRRESEWDNEKRVTRRKWIRSAFPRGRAMVVGKRTYSNGYVRSDREYDDMGGSLYTVKAWVSEERFEAYLVVFDIRQKPVAVLPEDLERVDASS